jgi:hypothetical protein
MPIREEARVVDWLVAAARRLGGAVHLDNSGVVLVPRADAAVDLTVYSNLWLVPGAALSLVKMIDPTFRPAMEFQRWAGPGGGPLAAASQGAAIDLPSELRADLHRRADAYDARALSQEPVVDRYALRADLGPAGTVWLEVEGVEVPEALRRLPWTESGVVSYGLHWDPADPANLLAEFPSPAQRAERVAAAALLARLALAIHSATGLEILDADAFPVDAADL